MIASESKGGRSPLVWERTKDRSRKPAGNVKSRTAESAYGRSRLPANIEGNMHFMQ